jgi:hypothetical protein
MAVNLYRAWYWLRNSCSVPVGNSDWYAFQASRQNGPTEIGELARKFLLPFLKCSLEHISRFILNWLHGKPAERAGNPRPFCTNGGSIRLGSWRRWIRRSCGRGSEAVQLSKKHYRLSMRDYALHVISSTFVRQIFKSKADYVTPDFNAFLGRTEKFMGLHFR